jgi:glycosyltransferase involved in cell wall biosynthesis
MADNRRRPRILHVSGYADVAGGGQISLLLLLKHLDRESFDLRLACPDEGEVALRARELGIVTRSLGLGRSLDAPTAIFHARALRKHAVGIGAHLVHCDTLSAAVMCGMGLLGLRIPTIFHARTSESGGALDAIASRLCARVICVSRAVAHRFPTRDPGKVRVVYNGVDLAEFTPQPGGGALRDLLGISREAFVVGYAGQVRGGKGLDTLIEAFALLQAECESARLLIVGRGPDEALLTRAAGAGVRFLPFSDSMAGFYSALDVFAFPTEFGEGLSRSLIESMACAIPSVATPLGGNRETVVDGETGFFVPPRDPRRLRDCLRELCLDPGKRRSMGAAARHRAETLFDAAVCTRGVEELYRELCPCPADPRA